MWKVLLKIPESRIINTLSQALFTRKLELTPHRRFFINLRAVGRSCARATRPPQVIVLANSVSVPERYRTISKLVERTGNFSFFLDEICKIKNTRCWARSAVVKFKRISRGLCAKRVVRVEPCLHSCENLKINILENIRRINFVLAPSYKSFITFFKFWDPLHLPPPKLWESLEF
jgi:hypothetical protein